MSYMFIRQYAHRVPDEQLNDILVTAASQVWLEFAIPTIVYRWRKSDLQLSEHWFVPTNRVVIFSSTIH